MSVYAGCGFAGLEFWWCVLVSVLGSRLKAASPPGLFVLVGAGGAARDSPASTRPLEGMGDDVQKLCTALWAALC